MTDYYLIESTSMNTCSMTKEGDLAALSTWLCPGCKLPRPGTEAVDVNLDARPPRIPFNFVWGAGVNIVTHEFAASLRNAVPDGQLFFGRVLNASGDELKGWETVIGKRRTIIRGSKDVSHRRCPECGRIVYFATGAQYLSPPPDPEFQVFDVGGGLVVTGDVKGQVLETKWKNVAFRPLEVLKDPRDGLGTLTELDA
jgi:hypothetical protein